MGMLSKGIKLLTIVIVSSFFGCSTSDEVGPITQVSKSTIGHKEYQKVLDQISDSLGVWSKAKLLVYQSYWAYNGRLDSTICFNKEKNKLVGALLVQCNLKGCLQDDVHYFYGVKIRKTWFFTKGANLTLPREMYQDDVGKPLSFEKLHEIALNEIFKKYLIKKDDKWEINERYFQYHFGNDAYNFPYTTQDAWEASYIKLINENWKKRAEESRETP